MRNWGKSGIKIIDFGTSCFQGKQIYQYLQSRYYRAPEIILRTPYSFPIDMWSLGCLLAELKLGQPIFAGSSNIQQLTYIVNSIGTPKKKDGIFSNAFLQNEEIDRLISDRYVQNYHEMKLTNDIPLVFANFKYHNICMVPLEDRLKECKKYDQDFYRFLLKILVWEPSQRLTPAQALQDSWILKGLPTEIKELYTVFNSV